MDKNKLLLAFFVFLFFTTERARGNMLQEFTTVAAKVAGKVGEHCAKGSTCKNIFKMGYKFLGPTALALGWGYDRLSSKETKNKTLWWKLIIDNKSSQTTLFPIQVSKMDNSGNLKTEFLDILPGGKVTHEWEYDGNGPNGGGGIFIYEAGSKLLKINVYIPNSMLLQEAICAVSIEYKHTDGNTEPEYCPTPMPGKYVKCGHAVRYLLMDAQPISCTVISSD